MNSPIDNHKNLASAVNYIETERARLEALLEADKLPSNSEGQRHLRTIWTFRLWLYTFLFERGFEKLDLEVIQAIAIEELEKASEANHED
jgi:hypothetical protein